MEKGGRQHVVRTYVEVQAMSGGWWFCLVEARTDQVDGLAALALVQAPVELRRQVHQALLRGVDQLPLVLDIALLHLLGEGGHRRHALALLFLAHLSRLQSSTTLFSPCALFFFLSFPGELLFLRFVAASLPEAGHDLHGRKLRLHRSLDLPDGCHRTNMYGLAAVRL